MNRAVGAYVFIGHWNMGVAPCWYKADLWPIIAGKPQSLSLIAIRAIFITKNRQRFLQPNLRSKGRKC